jgi:predicted RNA methylase
MRILRRIRDEFFPSKDAFDLVTGCETSGLVSRQRLRVNAVDGGRYQPVDPSQFHAAMGHLRAREDLSEFTFVDLGCGKGRAMILAREYGFHRVMGVEYSGKLVRIARSNLAQSQVLADVFEGDAITFGLPEGPSVVFMYNPFGPHGMAKLRHNLLMRRGERCYVIYINPVYSDVLNLGKIVSESGYQISMLPA